MCIRDRSNSYSSIKTPLAQRFGEEYDRSFFLSKKYTYKNILSFGDTLHKVHPLAGQGFNMTVRDIKSLTDQIQKNKDLGLELSPAIIAFEKDRKHNNFFFAYGIDFLHNFFEKENRFKRTN